MSTEKARFEDGDVLQEDRTLKEDTVMTETVKADKGELDDGSSAASILADGERKAAERRLIRKLDMRLLPTIILIYIMNYIDVR